MPEQPPSYSLRDAAAMLRRSERTLWSLVQGGRIHAAKHGRAWELEAASVTEFARANGIPIRGDDPRSALPPVPPAHPEQSRGAPGTGSPGTVSKHG